MIVRDTVILDTMCSTIREYYSSAVVHCIESANASLVLVAWW